MLKLESSCVFKSKLPPVLSLCVSYVETVLFVCLLVFVVFWGGRGGGECLFVCFSCLFSLENWLDMYTSTGLKFTWQTFLNFNNTLDINKQSANSLKAERSSSHWFLSVKYLNCKPLQIWWVFYVIFHFFVWCVLEVCLVFQDKSLFTHLP
mgnify:CR=1 FL=1